MKRFIWLVLAVFLIGGCSGSTKSEWNNDFSGALKRAQSEEKNILLILSKDGCPWCKKLKNETLADNEVRDLIEKNFVLVLLESPKDSAQIESIGIRSRSVPATILLDTKGREFGRLVGYLNPTAYRLEIEALIK